MTSDLAWEPAPRTEPIHDQSNDEGLRYCANGRRAELILKGRDGLYLDLATVQPVPSSWDACSPILERVRIMCMQRMKVWDITAPHEVSADVRPTSCKLQFAVTLSTPC